ncbi:MAG: hypothetical protein VKJ64_02945 [Leptolyngbyaceae bacterium]|nr:hypothetical protein [Leptolyngbyaceae bacterium]
MNSEDFVTMQAFSTALTRLQQQEQSLPDDVREELAAIAPNLPESAWELYDLAERYEPIKQLYDLALQDLPGEGERLKFATAEVEQQDASLTTAEQLVQELQLRIAELSFPGLKSAEDSFRQGWREAMAGNTRPVSALWDGIDAE